jgi:DNA-binding NarL/FixJ family response regulator
MPRLIIADDHTLFRLGLRQLLEAQPGFMVVAEAANAQQTLAAAQNVDADLLICDLTMPDVVGTQLIEQLHQHYPELPILVLSMHDEPATVRRALHAGASGYLTKEASPELLKTAVERVLSGDMFVTPALEASLAYDSLHERVERHRALSQRELEVFRLIVQGTPLAQIGEQLHLSPKTITTHKTHLMEKLDVANNADLIRYALENRLFD